MARYPPVRPVDSGECRAPDGCRSVAGSLVQDGFRGDVSGRPPDGCPDDPSEWVVYQDDADRQATLRTTGPPFPSDVSARHPDYIVEGA